MLSIFLVSFLSSMLFVFLKAFQQLNVVSGKTYWIMPTSLAMAACEVYVVAQAATQGWGLIVLPIGIGAGIGCLFAMYIHKILGK